MDCKQTNNLAERLDCDQRTTTTTTMANQVNIANQELNLDLHKEMHNTTILLTLGGVAGLMFIGLFCLGMFKMCQMAWRRESERLQIRQEEFRRFSDKP